MIVAGLLLSAASVCYLLLNSPESEPQRLLSASEFHAVVGRARNEGSKLVVSGRMQPDNYQRAILSSLQTINTEKYRYISLTVDPPHAARELTLFWRSIEQPDEFHSQPFPALGLPGNTLDMKHFPGWQGDIAEIGLIMESRTTTFPATFSGMTLEPGGKAAPALQSLISQWTAFRNFDQTTINWLPASFSAKALSPVLIAAGWSALGLALLLLARLFWRPPPFASFLLVILFGWMLLDLLWQRQLTTHLGLTQHLFQGKSIEARHLRDIDSEYYEHAMQIKREVLPIKPARIFILHDSVQHDYQRLKTQYYLLPHNIYNFGLFPPVNGIVPGDFLLVLGDIPGLNIDAAGDTFTWGNGSTLPVQQKHSHPLGKLYQVVAESPL